MKNYAPTWPIFFYILAVCSLSLHAKLDIDFEEDDKKSAPLQIPTPPQPIVSTPKMPTEKIVLTEAQQITDDKNSVENRPLEMPAAEIEEIIEEIEDIVQEGSKETVAPAESEKIEKKRTTESDPLISFDFKDEKLTTIINLIAAKKGINIVLPQNGIKTTITLEQKKSIPLSRAEQYLYMFLDLAGYNIYPTNGFFVISQKSESTDTREPYHLYVNVPPQQLPHNSAPIRAIYYLTNWQVPANSTGTDPLTTILRDMIGAKKFFYDQKSNAIILIGAADKIASAMNIVLEIDTTGSAETVIMVPLFHANADIVATWLQQIIATAKGQGGGRIQIKGETGIYFTPNTRAIADARTNSLILLGSESALIRIKDFIQEYLDAPPESGKSILHVQDLQYLDAKEFAQVLKKLVDSSKSQTQKDKGSGPHRFLEEVVIVAEEDKKAAAAEVSGGTTKAASAAGQVVLGGNRIIVTAKHEDWKVIKELIEQLDKPQLQTIIDIMIVDITVVADKAIQAQTRNPLGLGLHDNMEFQTANIQGQILELDPLTNKPISLTADLLRLLGGTPNVSMAIPASSDTNNGSMIISLNDPCKDSIWSVLKILDSFTEKTIISNPYLVTKNNVKASETVTTMRRAEGREVATSGVSTVKIEDFPATLKVAVTPRISSMNRLTLQIRIDIENFIDDNPLTFNKNSRLIETNATMSPGQILVLGGLTRTQDGETVTGIPILRDIPIFGQLFKGTRRSKRKTNLAIFIHPTIINPKLRSGLDKFTNDNIIRYKKDLNSEELFSGSKQPITRMFFEDKYIETGNQYLEKYLQEAHYTQANNTFVYSAQEVKALHLTKLNGGELPTSQLGLTPETAPELLKVDDKENKLQNLDERTKI